MVQTTARGREKKREGQRGRGEKGRAQFSEDVDKINRANNKKKKTLAI